MQVAKKIMPVKEKDEKLKNVFSADEVFITNTTSEVLPVVRIDGKKIGKGKVGEWTKELMVRFGEVVGYGENVSI